MLYSQATELDQDVGKPAFAFGSLRRYTGEETLGGKQRDAAVYHRRKMDMIGAPCTQRLGVGRRTRLSVMQHVQIQASEGNLKLVLGVLVLLTMTAM